MLKASRLGFGVSGAHGFALVPPSRTLALLAEAYQAGVRVFDTAPAYGNGEAERRLGRALRAMDRDQVTVSTKVGVSGSSLSGLVRDFSPDGVEASLLASLDRLGVEGVDVVFLHGAAPVEWTPLLRQRLSDLRQAGAFKLLGAAGRGLDLERVVEKGWTDCVMTPVHAFLETEERDYIEKVARADLSVFAIETAGDAPAPLRFPRAVSDLYGLAKTLRGPSGGRGRTSVADGLRAALANPHVSVSFFTTTKHRHLQMNLALEGLS